MTFCVVMDLNKLKISDVGKPQSILLTNVVV